MNLESLAVEVNLVIPAVRVLEDHLEIHPPDLLDNQVQTVTQALLVHKERRETQGLKEIKDQVEILAFQGHPAIQVSLDLLLLQDQMSFYCLQAQHFNWFH